MMKKTIMFLVILILSGCGTMRETVKQTDFYYFGINAQSLKELSWWKVGLGAAASVGVHCGGHWAYAKLNNIDIHQHGFSEIIDSDTNKKREFALSGLVLQNGVGLILTSIPASRKWDFTKGYVGAAWIETVASPMVSNDLKLSRENGGNTNIEYAVNLGIATHNMLRIKWTK